MSSGLSTFGLAEMLRCSIGLRRVTRDAATMETAARRTCKFLYDELVAPDDSRACALIRCYKTHPYGTLDPALQESARRMLAPGTRPAPEMKCLTLLATVGERASWNDRRLSKGHQAIPLPTPDMVERAPMIAQLIRAFGLDLDTVVRPSPEVVRDLAGRSYGVFYVAEALNSPYIPDNDFVEQHGIRSVVGFGGVLATGDLFAVILFARVPVPADGADRFRTLALDLKGRFFLYGADEIFDAFSRIQSSAESSPTLER